MTPADDLAVEECAAAELRGDWSTAFERHRAVPMFSQSQHGGRLRLMAQLGDDAPDWLRARFLTVMARRWEMYGRRRRVGLVLQEVVPVIYPDHVPLETIGCEHPEQVAPWIHGRDWVVRQVDAYDLDGLRDLLDLPAAAGAVTGAGDVAAWCDAPMGGWRVVGSDGEVAVVADAATGEEVELLDLGLTHLHPAGTHVLGRVVPTRAAPGRLFDWRPLAVDEHTAVAVAGRPDHWLRTVGAHVRSGRLPLGFAHLSDTSVSADLPQQSWGTLLGHDLDADLPRPPWCLSVDALRAALALAVGDPAALHRQRHVVAELLLDEYLDDTTLARFISPTYADAWRALAATLPDHAARRCREALWLLDASTPDDLAG